MSSDFEKFIEIIDELMNDGNTLYLGSKDGEHIFDILLNGHDLIEIDLSELIKHWHAIKLNLNLQKKIEEQFTKKNNLPKDRPISKKDFDWVECNKTYVLQGIKSFQNNYQWKKEIHRWPENQWKILTNAWNKLNSMFGRYVKEKSKVCWVPQYVASHPNNDKFEPRYFLKLLKLVNFY